MAPRTEGFDLDGDGSVYNALSLAATVLDPALFDLQRDPTEQVDLLLSGLSAEAAVAHDALSALLAGVDD